MFKLNRDCLYLIQQEIKIQAFYNISCYSLYTRPKNVHWTFLLDKLSLLQNYYQNIVKIKGKGQICMLIAWKGSIECMQWAKNKEFPICIWPSEVAARYGHLELLKWMKEAGYPLGDSTCHSAALGTQLDVLKWLRYNNIPWDDDVCRAAAYKGDLMMLDWISKNGSPPRSPHRSSSLCSEAIEGGNLDVLKWAITRGCSFDKNSLIHDAEIRGYHHIAEWIRDNY